jgi:chloramphenicol O-acetyltransferase type A
MRWIDPERGPRRDHFRLFHAMESPHTGVCFEADIDRLWRHRKRSSIRPSILLLYALTAAANRVPEFRQRIRDGRIVEHDVVHPSMTVLGPDDLFGFFTVPFIPDLTRFAEDAQRRLQAAKVAPSVEDEPGRDDLLYMAPMPWLSFTSITHPVGLDPPDSIPRIAWGKVRRREGRYVLPMGIHAHHAVVDGIHIARVAARIEEEARRLGDTLERDPGQAE